MSRWYVRAAIVLWPKAARLRTLGLAASLSLLESAAKGCADALSGCKDLATMQKTVAEISDGWTPAHRQTMLQILDSDQIPFSACADFLKRVQLADIPGALAALRALLVRHGCSLLSETLAECFSTFASAARTEDASAQVWADLGQLFGWKRARKETKPTARKSASTPAARKSAPTTTSNFRPARSGGDHEDCVEKAIAESGLTEQGKESARRLESGRVLRLRERVTDVDAFKAVLKNVLEEHKNQLSSLAAQPMTMRRLQHSLEMELGLELDDLVDFAFTAEPDWQTCFIFDEVDIDIDEATADALEALGVDQYDCERGGSGCTPLDDLHQQATGQLVGGPPGARALFRSLAYALLPSLASAAAPAPAPPRYQSYYAGQPTTSASTTPEGAITTVFNALSAMIHLKEEALIEQALQLVTANRARFPALFVLGPVISKLSDALQSHKPKAPLAAIDHYKLAEVPRLMQQYAYRSNRPEAVKKAEAQWLSLSAAAKQPFSSKSSEQTQRFLKAMEGFTPRVCPYYAKASRALAEAVVVAIEAPTARVSTMDAVQLSSILGILVDNDAERCLSTLSTRSPAFPSAVAAVLAAGDRTRRNAVLSKAAWPKALLAAAHANAIILQSDTSKRAWLEVAFQVLGEFDAASGDSASQVSWRAQLAAAVLEVRAQSTAGVAAASGLAYARHSVLVDLLKPLHASLEPTAQLAAWFRQLLAAGIEVATRDVKPEPALIPPLAPLPPLKDHSIKITLPCGARGCSQCQPVVAFLASPTETTRMFAGTGATHSGHITTTMQRAAMGAKEPADSSFAVQVLSGKSARVHGRMQITKRVPGASSPAQLAARASQERTRQADRAQKVRARDAAIQERNRQLATASELQQLDDRLAQLQEERTRHVPVDVRLFHKLCEAISADDTVTANDLARALDERKEGALDSVDNEQLPAPDVGSDADVLMDGEQIAEWVANFLAADDAGRARIKQAVVENEVDSLEILGSMSHSDLSQVLIGDGATTPSEPTPFVRVRRLWLALQRRKAAAEGIAVAADTRCIGVDEVAQWLRQRGVHGPAVDDAALSIDADKLRELGLDGAVLCSLSREEWLELARSLLRLPDQTAEELWGRLAPVAALSAATPHRIVDALPVHTPTPFKAVVVGGTGAGKSTLINALLGCSILPTSCMRACTAAVIEMAWPKEGSSSAYEARVALCSADEWKGALTAACAAATAAGPGKSPQDGVTPGAADWSRAMSFYGTSISITAEALAQPGASDALIASLMEGASARGLGSEIFLQASDEAEFARLVRPYVDSSDDADGGALWPVVQRVTLHGPFSLLSTGLRLYDVPGTHDENAARASVMKSVISQASAVLLTSNIRRACNDKSAKDLLPLSLRKVLLESGWAGELAFVASQSDIFNRSELIDNLSLREDATSLECALARNTFTKKQLTRDFTSNLPSASLSVRPACAPGWQCIPFTAMPVFTVSAVEHKKLTSPRAQPAGGGGEDGGDDDEDGAQVFSSPSQTELPALVSFLRYATLAHHRRALEAGASSSSGRPPIGATLLECLSAQSSDRQKSDADTSGGGGDEQPWAHMSAKEILTTLRRAGISTIGCTERTDLVELARRHPQAFSEHASTGGASAAAATPSDTSQVAGTRAADIPTPAAPTSDAQHTGAASFVPSASFAGARTGYVFREGPHGFGYYADGAVLAPADLTSAAKRPAPAPAPAAAKKAKAGPPTANDEVVDLLSDSD